MSHTKNCLLFHVIFPFNCEKCNNLFVITQDQTLSSFLHYFNIQISKKLHCINQKKMYVVPLQKNQDKDYNVTHGI